MCDESGAIRGGKSQMEKHTLVHKTGKLLKCHVCLKVFDDFDHKREHEDIHVKEENITHVRNPSMMEPSVGQSTVPRVVFAYT